MSDARLSEAEVDVIARWVHSAALGMLCKAVERILADRLAAVEAERDALRATVARVEDLAEQWSLTLFPDGVTAATMQRDIGAALMTEEGE